MKPIVDGACPNCLNTYLERERHVIGGMGSKPVPETSWRMMRVWSGAANRFVEALYREGFSLFGGQPSAFSFCTTGSMARQEACPHSDLDAFIVVPPGLSQAQMSTWENVNSFVDARLRAVNDVRANVLRPGKGFIFCVGGLNPLGKVTDAFLARRPEVRELLGEGNRIAQLTNQPAALAAIVGNYHRNPLTAESQLTQHAVSGMMECAHGFGEQSLHRALIAAIGEATSQATSSRTELGLDLIKQAVTSQKFRPPEPGARRIDVKTQYYRAPQFILKGLSWYFGIGVVESFDQITALVKAGHLHSSRGYHFRKAMAAPLSTRVAAHLHTKEETDFVFRAGATLAQNEEGYLQLSAGETAELTKAARHVKLVMDWAERFLRDQANPLTLGRNVFAKHFGSA